MSKKKKPSTHVVNDVNEKEPKKYKNTSLPIPRSGSGRQYGYL